jgi:hypothetical protein
MIRYEGFKGFFIMKKDADGGWEYLSSYTRRGENIYDKYAKDTVRYFPDSSIKSKLPWSIFNLVREKYPMSQVVLYVMIDNTIHRIKHYNPNAEKKITVWHEPEDFYCYIPQKEIR